MSIELSDRTAYQQNLANQIKITNETPNQWYGQESFLKNPN